jgi:hypothetical protein
LEAKAHLNNTVVFLNKKPINLFGQASSHLRPPAQASYIPFIAHRPVFKNSVPTSEKTQSFSITKFNLLMPFSGITRFYSDNYTEAP